MKKIIIISSGVLFILVSGGCKKFLDKEPDNRAKLNSPEKVSQLLASAYPQNNYQLMAELSSDNVDDNITNGSDVPSWSTLVENIYRFQDNKGTDEDGPESYWFGCYKAIAAANLALETIAAAPDPENYQAQKGEALVARAYSHFMLVNFFSKFYNATTAGTDKGIPYVTESETVSIKKYERKTVKYVYDMVRKDLLEGLPLIKDEIYSIPKYHFTKSAANAFASRYYLYKKNYDSVIIFAKAALPESNIVTYLRPWNTVYTDLPLNGNGSLSAVYSKATENANLLLAESNSWWGYIEFLGKYGLTEELGSYFTGTAAGNYAPWSFRLATAGGHSIISKTDVNFVETSIGSGTGDGWQMVPLFTAEEVLFNLAEAYTYKGQTGNAINLLNKYLSTRIDGFLPTDNLDEAIVLDYYTSNYGLDELQAGILDIFYGIGSPTTIQEYYALTDAQKAVINIILDYRRTEYVHEGMRWFDILRYGFEIEHNIRNNQKEIVDVITLSPTNTHRVFEIPATARAQAGLESNR